MNEFDSGTFTGTGAAINVSLGWIPSYVKVYNNNDAGGKAPTMEWFQGMAAASGLKGLKVVDSGATGDASQAKVTVNGISEYAGSATAAPGFTIGADADVNAVGEVGYWVAFRGTAPSDE